MANYIDNAHELESEWVKLQIMNNDYYEKIREYYRKALVADLSCVSDILECWEWFDCYYSLYTIMDSIEEYMQRKGAKTIEDAIYAPDFRIKEA